MVFIANKMDKMIMKEEFIYYNPPESDQPLRLDLAGISYCDGTYRIHRDAGYPLHVFEYVESGTGTLEIGGQRFHPQAGDVYRVPAWTEHTYYSDARTPWTKYWFNLEGRLIEELVDLYRLQEQYLFRGCQEGGKIILETLEQLRQLDHEEAQSYMAVQGLKLIMALSSQGSGGDESKGGKNPLAYRLHAYLTSRTFQKMPSLEELSKSIHRSPIQTIRIFRKEFGITPHEFLLARKLNAGADLLSGSSRSIKSVADVLGFDDEYYFARVFKKKKGISPGAFRRNRTPSSSAGKG